MIQGGKLTMGTALVLIPLALSLLPGNQPLVAQSTPSVLAESEAGNGQTKASPKQANPCGGIQTETLHILSDTQGVDFSPYLSKNLMPKIRENWYQGIPALAIDKKGCVRIEFAVLKDGQLAGMKLLATSGDTALDRAAWDGITSSAPFPPLPTDFKGNYLALRVRFLYNPDPAMPASDAAQSDAMPPLLPDPSSLISSSVTPMNAPGPAHMFMPAILMAHTAESHMPKYPRQARQEKLEGPVQVTVLVRADGAIENVTAISGAQILADAAAHAIRSWHFYPAQRDSKPVEDSVRIRIDFRVNEKQVRFQVVPSETKAPKNPAP
jgi:TonB family protein